MTLTTYKELEQGSPEWLQARCGIEGCQARARARGWCYTHYSRWRIHGDPNVTLYIRGDNASRFWAKVDKERTAPAHAPQLGNCWEWTAGKNKGGYGEFSLDGKVQKAHRVSYAMAAGPIAKGVDIDHRCRNSSCVRPSHLRPVTNKQNHENRHIDSVNTSGYRGVSWVKARGLWAAYATHSGVRVYAGYFTDVHQAGEAARALRNSLFTHNDMDRGQAQ